MLVAGRRRTEALVSVGGVVSAAALTVMSNSSLTDPPLPSLAVTFTATVATSAAMPACPRRGAWCR